MELNKIILGDAYELIKTIPDKSIDLILTDPPYQIESLTGGGMAKEKHISNVMEELGAASLEIGIKDEILEEFMRVMKKPNIYIWCNKKQIYQYMNFFVGKYGLNFVPIVWHKTNAMPLCGGKYLDDCEYCLYFYKGIKLNTTYDTAATVYNLPINIQDKNDYKHPTIKNLEIAKNMVINSTNKGETVLDVFAGSGTHLVAAKETGRNYIGFEINPEYHRIATDRLAGINQKGEMNLFDIQYEDMNLFEEEEK